MKPFAVKLKDGGHLLGLGLAQADADLLNKKQAAEVDLSSAGVGLWFTDEDGKRVFIQPRDSKIVVIVGDTKADIGAFLGIKLP